MGTQQQLEMFSWFHATVGKPGFPRFLFLAFFFLIFVHTVCEFSGESEKWGIAFAIIVTAIKPAGNDSNST